MLILLDTCDKINDYELSDDDPKIKFDYVQLIIMNSVCLFNPVMFIGININIMEKDAVHDNVTGSNLEITFVSEKHVAEDDVLFTNHLVGK